MLCEVIRPKVRNFLDDLLDERDYQETHSHLAECEKCQAYASSVGTLSYRLYELGQIPAPLDLPSTVCYEFEKYQKMMTESALLNEPVNQKAQVSPDGAKPFNQLLWLMTLLFSVVLIIAGVVIYFFKSSQTNDSKILAELAQDHKESTSVSADGLQMTAKMDDYPHWHYHISAANHEDVQNFLRQKSIEPLHGSSNYTHFNIPRNLIPDFVNFISNLSGLAKEFGERVGENLEDEKVQISVFFESF